MELRALDRPSAADEVALVERCLRGERTAERDLFRSQYARVNATLYRVLGSNRESEDLVQEAFVEVFRSLPGFRHECRLSTWVDRIAARVAIHHLRARRPPAVQLEILPEPEDGEAPPDRRVQAREGLRRFYAALADLGPDARLAFALHVLDGRPLREVARLVGASTVTTKVRVWRARRELARRAADDPVLAAYVGSGGGAKETTP